METKNINEDRIINDFIQQIRIGNFKDENGHELINNESYINFTNLWFNDTLKISELKESKIKEYKRDIRDKYARYESKYMDDDAMCNDLLDMAEGIISAYRRLVKELESN